MLYKPYQQNDAAAVSDWEPYQAMDDTGWTPEMEADFRLRAYQTSKRKQRARRCCEGGFTLGAIVDAVGALFDGDESAGWVVLESVRRDDVYMRMEDEDRKSVV